MTHEPTTNYFAGLLDQLRMAEDAARPELINRLVAAAEPRVRRLTRAIIRGRMGLPGVVETDDVSGRALAGFADRLAKGLDGKVGSPKEMFNYVCGIIRRQATNAVRRLLGQRAGGPADPDAPDMPRPGSVRRPEPLSDGDELPGSGEPFVDGVLLRLTINDLVGTLPPHDQEFLNLRFVEAMTREQLAGHLGLTVEAVRWQELQLLKRLRRAAEGQIRRTGPQDPGPGDDS